MVAGVKEKVSVHVGDKDAVQRPVGQSFMRSWDCSQIENDGEEESWREWVRMAEQWEEEQKLEEIVEQRRIEGDSLKLEVMRKAPELVVHERMSQGEGVRVPKEMARVPGWSAEEMKEKPNTDIVADAEQMRKWRCLNKNEMDFCWKNLAVKKGRGSPGQVQGRRKQKRGFQR